MHVLILAIVLCIINKKFDPVSIHRLAMGIQVSEDDCLKIDLRKAEEEEKRRE